MSTALSTFLRAVMLGPEQRHGNLAIRALLADQEVAAVYLTLDEALAQGGFTITEIGAAGQVPALQVINNLEQRVLLLDGEELVGAKQNRVLNLTILLAPKSVTTIPVSCIERGRWSYNSRNFRSPQRAMSAALRKKKARSVSFCIRNFGSYQSDQGEIWEEIEAKFARAGIQPSPTQALSDLCEVRQDRSNDYLQHFSPCDRQLGLAAFIDGALAGVELLGRYDTLQRLYDKLVGSYILDALETAQRGVAAATASDLLADFLEEAAAAIPERRPSVALGWDFRLESSTVLGAGLEFEDQILQLSLFQREAESGNGEAQRSLRRASLRRQGMRR